MEANEHILSSDSDRQGMPGHLWTRKGDKRGAISDRNAYLRMKRHVTAVLDSYGVWDRHTMAKAVYEDDALVIHGYPKFTCVEETVLHALDNNGIQYKHRRARSRLFGKEGILWVCIPIDQAACPPGRRSK